MSEVEFPLMHKWFLY